MEAGEESKSGHGVISGVWGDEGVSWTLTKQKTVNGGVGGRTEVCEDHVAIGIDENVLELEVAVDDANGV